MNAKLKEKLKAMGIEAGSMTQEEVDSEGILMYYGPGSEALCKAMQKKSGESDAQQQPQNPEKFVEALKKRGIKVNVMSMDQLEARRQAELEYEGWHGKQNPKNK